MSAGDCACSTFLEGVDLSDLPPLLCVPPPVLTSMLRYLDGRDLTQVSATSRPLRRLAMQERLWAVPFLMLLCDMYESSPTGRTQAMNLFHKDKDFRALLKKERDPRASWRRLYRDKAIAFQKQQRKERERKHLAGELKVLRQRVFNQRKSLSGRFDAWKNCVAGDSVFRFYFYIPAVLLLLSLIMLHARLSYTPTLPWLAVCAPFSLTALVIGTLLLATGLLYLPTFQYPNDRVVRLCFGYLLLARRSVEFSAAFMAYGCTLVSLCVYIVLLSLYHDSLVAVDLSLVLNPEQPVPQFQPLHISIASMVVTSLPAALSTIMGIPRFCPGYNDPLPPECVKCLRFHLLTLMYLVPIQCVGRLLGFLFGGSNPIGGFFFGGNNSVGAHAGLACVLCVVGAAIIARGTVTAYRQAQRRITSLVLAAASGVLFAAFSAVFLLLVVLKDYAVLDVSYDVVFVPAWLAWAACFGMVVLLDEAGCLVWDTVFGYFGSFFM